MNISDSVKQNDQQGIEWNIPYDSTCSLFTHPRQLAAVALQNGIQPAPIENARILELGCATGGNLTPIAASIPTAECIGIDPFEKQIIAANDRAKATHIHNVKYLPLGVSDYEQLDGQFDYIIAHGLYSWISDQHRHDTLKLCQKKLSPNGVAYISYNTYPGWHKSEILRQLLLWQKRHRYQSQTNVESDSEQIKDARALLKVFAQYSYEAIQSFYAKQQNKISSLPDWYIVHEYLLEHNVPRYLESFADELRQCHLSMVSDCMTNTRLTASFINPLLIRELQDVTHDYIALEQGIDFLVNRSMRRALITHSSSCPPSRQWTNPRHWGDEAMHTFNDQLFVAAPYKTPQSLNHLEQVTNYKPYYDGQSSIKIETAIENSLMLLLSTSWPESISLESLIKQSLTLLANEYSNTQNSLKLKVIRSLNNLIFKGIVYEPTFGKMLPTTSNQSELLPWLKCESIRSNMNPTNRYHYSIQVPDLEALVQSVLATPCQDYMTSVAWQKARLLGLTS